MIDNKPDHLKLIDAAASDDPFDLAQLRVTPEELEGPSVRKLLTQVPVRKPGDQDFIRVRPEPQFRETMAFIELKDDREIYLLNRKKVPEWGEFFNATLFTAITRTGVVFLWPVKVSAADAKANEWHLSAATAAQHAMRHWIRVKANLKLRGYEIFEAEAANIPDPIWPSLSFEEIYRIAFRDRIVSSIDHPVLKQLRGG
jgi:hypothetical protein